MQTAEDSQKEWSAEYYARWTSTPQAGTLGHIPLLVLTRAKASFSASLDVSAEQLEHVRLASQAALLDLSSASTQWLVNAGHNMHLEAPEIVAAGILDTVRRIRLGLDLRTARGLPQQWPPSRDSDNESPERLRHRHFTL
jgi:hypothetical protein